MIPYELSQLAGSLLQVEGNNNVNNINNTNSNNADSPETNSIAYDETRKSIDTKCTVCFLDQHDIDAIYCRRCGHKL